MTKYPTFEHDVLVIGAGGAGLRAAIEASAAGGGCGIATMGGGGNGGAAIVPRASILMEPGEDLLPR